ncbi:hypothetical protein J1N35_038293 [Gossypium stocksii]|uniref:DUF4283 domain-containing protein n=1 Tax=Gossypium stocksii TaxID=47602 RepID=A0A9D3ZMH8_9ROSI|nr:hypothetical protein J1N35_038293 [Gossypium stocksii]
MEADIANLNLDDEEEASIPCEGDLHKEDKDNQFCLVGKVLTNCVIHFPSLKRTLDYLWHSIGGIIISNLEDKRYLFRFFYEVDIKRGLDVHNLSYGAISKGLARKLRDIIGQRVLQLHRKRVSTKVENQSVDVTRACGLTMW